MVTTRRQSNAASKKAAQTQPTGQIHANGSPSPPPLPSPPAGNSQPFESPSSSSQTPQEPHEDRPDTEIEEPVSDSNGSEGEEDDGDSQNDDQSESQPEVPPNRTRGRGRSWQPWEDRILAKEVLAKRAFDPPYGQTVTEEQTRAMQATGTDEEVDEHVQTMTEAVQLIDDLQVRGEKASESAKLKMEKERQAGIEMRRAAMQNMVLREELIDVADLETATVRERQGQRKRQVHISIQTPKPELNSPPNDDTDKENVAIAGPSKKRRSNFQSAMTKAFREHQAKEDKVLEEARKRAEDHHTDLQDGLARLEQSMNRVGDALIQSMEQNQRSQDLILGLIAGSNQGRNEE
ncbi:hypothetical protein FRC00_010872 [Tulasnella sp. 408]|nr:hypothetical protein FRC00_010872 [Tulasnella sp. 408]